MTFETRRGNKFQHPLKFLTALFRHGFVIKEFYPEMLPEA